MRYLLVSTLLLLGFSSLHAATFLERFNSLEQEIQNVQDEIDLIKKGGGAKSGTNDSKTKALQEEVQKLKESQKTLETKVSSLKSQPLTKGSDGAIANKDIEELKKAIRRLKKAQKSLNAKVKSSKRHSATNSADGATSLGIDDDAMEEVQEQFDEISKSLADIRKFTNGNHMKITADFRTAVDNINYVLADGSETGNDSVLTNRLWINMKYKATQKVSFTGQLAYYKTFGARSGTGSFSTYDDFDWITNSTANDDAVRLKKAYFFYADDKFLGTDIPWTFSLGRRPSTNGHLAHFRDDDEPSSPLAHFINVEFDGLSSKFDLSNLTGVTGMYLKFCLGRGQTNAAESLTTTPYATESNSDRPDIDMAGVIFSLYNNGQYSLTTQTVLAKDLIDLNASYTGFEAVGDLSSFSANFTAEGIGTEGAPFLGQWLGRLLDETIFFVSYANSRTDPYTGGSMLGSTKSEVGHSYWAGLQLPTLSKKGRWGMEFNKGDQYWKSITYSEDTLVGSKIAARGEATEVYWTEPFANDTMSWQLRYTYIDYKYAGSNGFFGSVTGGSSLITSAFGTQAVDKASDLRFYLRYRY